MTLRILLPLVLLACVGCNSLASVPSKSSAVDELIDATHQLEHALDVTSKQRDEFLAQIQDDTKTIQKMGTQIHRLQGMVNESIGQTEQCISAAKSFKEKAIQ